MKRISIAFTIAIACVGIVSQQTNALEVPPTPTEIPIVDQTNTLSSDEITTLAGKISAERTSTGNQIGVLIIPTLQNDSLEDYSLRVARSWGVGAKDRNSGVLLLIVKDDRKIRIEVGYGLEGALTDIQSGRIIRDRIAPSFREGRYYDGVSSGVDGIILAIHGEADPNLAQSAAEDTKFPWEFILFGIVFMFSWLGAILGRSKSWWAGGVIGAVAGVIAGFVFGFLFVGIISIFVLTIGGLLFDKYVSANYRRHSYIGDSPSWWAGGGFLGGGGSGNSDGGFGGGGFGGGGASGDW